MARALMVQGCSSNAGKSYLTAGLCRLYANKGVKVAPFKAQNMSNNAGVTPDGLEMGRAQLLQAQAARVTPDTRMNPILIKPEGDNKSQVVVLGKPELELSRLPWMERKQHLWGSVRESLHNLLDQYELLIIEGAGSPAEVNLKSGDIVNMRVAKEAHARVLLAADIDRGGAFAHLLGTWNCFDSEEKTLLLGFILNKFRGDSSLLTDGLAWLKARTGVPALGVVPYLKLPLPDEDAFSLEPPPAFHLDHRPVIAILRTPAISNFDEFDALVHEPGVTLRWVQHPNELQDIAALILPGSKSVATDLSWLDRTGLAARIQALAQQGVPILGVCGGFQMLGREVRDPHGVERGGTIPGLGLLEVETELATAKITRQVAVRLLDSRELLTGYEIHHGRTRASLSARPFLENGLGYTQGSVVGVYVHGLFDNELFRKRFLSSIGVVGLERDWRAHVDEALDRLAEHLGASLDMDAIDRELVQAKTNASTLYKTSAHPPSRLYLITGGARSGKSRYAEALATALGGEGVTYIATLKPDDEEMKRRIARHRARRPTSWRTVETTVKAADTLLGIDTEVVLLDCLSGLVSNLLLEHEAEGGERAIEVILDAVGELIEVAQTAGKSLIVVTNEVGDGVVPPYPLGRSYRDALGLANQQIAKAADAVSRVTVGIAQTLKGRFPEVNTDA